MSNAAARVLALFLRTPKQGVTGVTHVTGRSVTCKSPAVTMVTPVTYQKQQAAQAEEHYVTSAQSDPEQTGISFEERAGIIEYDGGAPRVWAEALAQLDITNAPADVPLPRWRRFIDDCGHFLDQGWASRAEALGWGPFDLFGCDREKPLVRREHKGLVWLVNGGKIRELRRDGAIIETPSGALQSYQRRPVDVARVVLAWELIP